MIGIVNCREYWMNAWTSPSDIVPWPPHAADHGDRDVVQVAEEVHRRLDDPGDELGPVAGLVELLVLGLERRDRLALVAEDLDDGVARVHLLDEAVEGPGPRPLGGELGRERRAMKTVVAMADGTTSSEITARSGLIVNMISRTPMTVRTDVIAWVIVCCRVWAMLSMSFVTRLRVSPRGMPVEVPQRQAGELEVDLLAQLVDRPLGDAGDDVGRRPTEQGAHDVDRRHEQQHAGQGREVDPLAGDHGHPGQHVGQWPWPPPRPASACCWVSPAGICLPMTPSNTMSWRSQQLWPDDARGDAEGRQDDHGDDLIRSARSSPTRRQNAPLKSFGLAAAASRRRTSRPGRWGRARAAEDRDRAATRRESSRSRSSAHATSASLSCEKTISR